MKRFVLLLSLCWGLCASAAARPIRGTVKCGGKPLEGITVTDGYSFARSDAAGEFTLDTNDDALFISVVTPSGYIAPTGKEAVPQFYRPYVPATKRYDFCLRRGPQPAKCTNCWR